VASLLLSQFPTYSPRSDCLHLSQLERLGQPRAAQLYSQPRELPALSGSSLHTSRRWSIFAFNPVCSTVTRPMPRLAYGSLKVGTRRLCRQDSLTTVLMSVTVCVIRLSRGAKIAQEYLRHGFGSV
jgi:hypothetical protein